MTTPRRRKHEEEVLALFPTEKWTNFNNNITCYARVGQHGEAARELLNCKRAKPSEYYALLKELRAIYENPVLDNKIFILKIK